MNFDTVKSGWSVIHIEGSLIIIFPKKLYIVIFIPRHTLVSGYYVIPFGVCPSVRPSVLTISDR